MPTLQESGLQFTFTPDWIVKRFDKHRYYKWLSGVGIKGVDFIGIYKGQQLFLIEVKNYRRRNERQLPEHLIPDSSALGQAFADKILDSLQVIQTIIGYLKRRWWYAMAHKIVSQLPSRYRWRWDWYFWSQAQQLIEQHPDRVRIVLWLEEAQSVLESSGSIKGELEAVVSTQLNHLSFSRIEVVNIRQNSLEGINCQLAMPNNYSNS